MYHDAMRDEHAASTRKSAKHRLRAFIQFCDEHGIENLNDLDGRDIHKYRIWRREGNGDGRESIKPVTLKGQLATLRRFLRFAANIDAVPPELYEQVTLPTMKNGQDVSDTTLKPERAIAILQYLEQAHPSSRDHIILLLLWETGARTRFEVLTFAILISMVLIRVSRVQPSSSFIVQKPVLRSRIRKKELGGIESVRKRLGTCKITSSTIVTT
jgi:site-specific recombinase XerD